MFFRYNQHYNHLFGKALSKPQIIEGGQKSKMPPVLKNTDEAKCYYCVACTGLCPTPCFADWYSELVYCFLLHLFLSCIQTNFHIYSGIASHFVFVFYHLLNISLSKQCTFILFPNKINKNISFSVWLSVCSTLWLVVKGCGPTMCDKKKWIMWHCLL